LAYSLLHLETPRTFSRSILTMASNTNTAALDAQNANIYQNPNLNPTTTQTTTTQQTTTTGQVPETHPTSRAAVSTIGGGDAPTTHSGGIGQQIKGAFAQGHGVGEVIRGKFNSAVDTAAGDPQGQAKNKNIATGGEREFANKDFVKKGTLDKAL
ncbi:chitin synthase 2, partial [Colletotrichum tofieldiae]